MSFLRVERKIEKSKERFRVEASLGYEVIDEGNDWYQGAILCTRGT